MESLKYLRKQSNPFTEKVTFTLIVSMSLKLLDKFKKNAYDKNNIILS